MVKGLENFLLKIPEEHINMKNIGLDIELDVALQILEKVFK